MRAPPPSCARVADALFAPPPPIARLPLSPPDNCVETVFTGRDAHAIVIYITSYIVKGELSAFNMFTILAEGRRFNQPLLVRLPYSALRVPYRTVRSLHPSRLWSPPLGLTPTTAARRPDCKKKQKFMAELHQRRASASGTAQLPEPDAPTMPYKRQLSKFINSITGSTEMCAQYAAAILRNDQLEWSSHSVVHCSQFSIQAAANALLPAARDTSPATNSTGNPSAVGDVGVGAMGIDAQAEATSSAERVTSPTTRSSGSLPAVEDGGAIGMEVDAQGDVESASRATLDDALDPHGKQDEAEEGTEAGETEEEEMEDVETEEEEMEEEEHGPVPSLGELQSAGRPSSQAESFELAFRAEWSELGWSGPPSPGSYGVPDPEGEGEGSGGGESAPEEAEEDEAAAGSQDPSGTEAAEEEARQAAATRRRRRSRPVLGLMAAGLVSLEAEDDADASADDATGGFDSGSDDSIVVSSDDEEPSPTLHHFDRESAEHTRSHARQTQRRLDAAQRDTLSEGTPDGSEDEWADGPSTVPIVPVDPQSTDAEPTPSAYTSVQTDGNGSVVRLLDAYTDYQYRASELSDISFVKFHLVCRKITRREATKSKNPRTMRHEFAPLHPQASGHVMVMYEDPEAHTVDFVGSIPTPRSSAPHADESWAQFVLINFKPWINDMAELLADDHGGTHSSWAAALADWPRDARCASDPLWYTTKSGELQHPFLQHKLDWFSGEDRAAVMSKARADERRQREELGQSDMDTHEAAHNQQHTADDSRDVMNFMHQLAYETSESNANNARRTRERQCLDQGPIDQVLAALGGGVDRRAARSEPEAGDDMSALVRDCEQVGPGALRQISREANRINTAVKHGDATPEDHDSAAGATGARRVVADEVIDYDQLVHDVVDGNGPGASRRVLDGPGRSTGTAAVRSDAALVFELIAHSELNCKQAVSLYFRVLDHEAKIKDPQRRGRMHGLFGGPGTGKSYVDTAFQRWLRACGLERSHEGCAFTGKAAAHQGYLTIHKVLGLVQVRHHATPSTLSTPTIRTTRTTRTLYTACTACTTYPPPTTLTTRTPPSFHSAPLPNLES